MVGGREGGGGGIGRGGRGRGEEGVGGLGGEVREENGKEKEEEGGRGREKGARVGGVGSAWREECVFVCCLLFVVRCLLIVFVLVVGDGGGVSWCVDVSRGVVWCCVVWCVLCVLCVVWSLVWIEMRHRQNDHLGETAG